MPAFKNPLGSLFGWISPRATHEKRDAKHFKTPDIRSPALNAAAKRKAQISKTSSTGSLQAATGNVPFNRKVKNAGEIVWEDEPPSSPAIVDTIENALAATALYDDDEMEDAGDEGAVDTMSEEDDSGLLDEEDEEVNSDIEDTIVIKKEASEADETEDNREESGTDAEDDDEDDEDEFDANRNTKVVDLSEDHEAALEAATRQFEIDREAKFEEQKAEAMNMIREGWTNDTIDLYMLIDRRTLETLMPFHWKMDFPLFPWTVFAEDYRDAFLGGTRPENDFIMIRAARELMKLPVHMRNQIRIKAWYGRRAEAMAVKYCEDYLKMIHKDSKLWVPLKKQKLVSLICYAAGDDKATPLELEDQILGRFRKRWAKLQEILRVEPGSKESKRSDLFWHQDTAYLVEPPTLWGIVAKHAVVGLVGYEPFRIPKKNEPMLRNIAFFHMSKPKYDVWNALALAVVMVHSRNHLLKIKEALPEDLDALELTDSETDL